MTGVVVASGLDGLLLLKPRLGMTAASPPAVGRNPLIGHLGDASRTAACLPKDS